MEKLFVANEIRRQIQMIDPRAFMAWGASDFIGSDEELSLNQCNIGKDLIPEDRIEHFGCRGWLKFKVRCPKHKGWVIVGLNGSDLYEIVLFSSCKKRGSVFEYSDKIHSYTNDIFSENLVEVIDTLVG